MNYTSSHLPIPLQVLVQFAYRSLVSLIVLFYIKSQERNFKRVIPTNQNQFEFEQITWSVGNSTFLNLASGQHFLAFQFGRYTNNTFNPLQWIPVLVVVYGSSHGCRVFNFQRFIHQNKTFIIYCTLP